MRLGAPRLRRIERRVGQALGIGQAGQPVALRPFGVPFVLRGLDRRARRPVPAPRRRRRFRRLPGLRPRGDRRLRRRDGACVDLAFVRVGVPGRLQTLPQPVRRGDGFADPVLPGRPRSGPAR